MSEPVLLKKGSARLDRLLQPVCQVCDKVRQRFVEEAVWSILAIGSLVVADLACHLSAPRQPPDYAAKRPCRELRSPHRRLDTSKGAPQRSGEGRGKGATYGFRVEEPGRR